MGKPSPAHLGMRELLTGMGLPFEEEVKVAGHRIDFVVQYGRLTERRLGVDVNGDRWHRWSKIRECDRVKLNRVFAPGVEPLVLGVWWSRLQSSPESVEAAILFGLETHRLAWWDWAVAHTEMTPASGVRAASLVVPEFAPVSPPTSPESGSNAAPRSRRR